VIAEDGGTGRAGSGLGERVDELGAVEKIVAQHERGTFLAGEEAGVSGDVEGLGEPVGAGCSA